MFSGNRSNGTVANGSGNLAQGGISDITGGKYTRDIGLHSSIGNDKSAGVGINGPFYKFGIGQYADPDKTSVSLDG